MIGRQLKDLEHLGLGNPRFFYRSQMHIETERERWDLNFC